MRLEFKEHELERALEQYLQLQFNKEVRVNGFDLSGMRSKDGLTAMVDITLLGETDQREPNQEKENEPKEPVAEKSDEYYQVLELLGSNPKNRNRKAIEELIEDNSVLVQQLSTVALYQDWLNQCLKDDALAAQQENSTQLSVDELETVETAETTLDTEEAEMDKVVMAHPDLGEPDDNQTQLSVPAEPDMSDEEEEALIQSMVTTTDNQKPASIVDEVTTEHKPSMFGTPLNKPHRKLFG